MTVSYLISIAQKVDSRTATAKVCGLPRSLKVEFTASLISAILSTFLSHLMLSFAQFASSCA